MEKRVDYNDHSQVIEYLIKYGYHNLLDIADNEAVTIDKDSVDFKRMIQHFQSFFFIDKGIMPDGVPGSVTFGMMEQPRCDCQDVEPRSAAHAHRAGRDEAKAKWALPCSQNLKVYAGLDGLVLDSTFPTIEKYEDIWYDCFKETERVCNFHAVRVGRGEGAHYACHAGDVGRGVLAWSYYPGDCDGKQVTSRFNDSINWREWQYTDTALHEIGHGLGLPHGPAGSVMYWTIDRNHGGQWESWDIKELVDRYGTPVPRPPEPEPPTPEPPEEEFPLLKGTIRLEYKGEEHHYALTRLDI
jgi:hypothetical protein